jgi:hypothetical protein
MRKRYGAERYGRNRFAANLDVKEDLDHDFEGNDFESGEGMNYELGGEDMNVPNFDDINYGNPTDIRHRGGYELDHAAIREDLYVKKSNPMRKLFLEDRASAILKIFKRGVTNGLAALQIQKAELDRLKIPFGWAHQEQIAKAEQLKVVHSVLMKRQLERGVANRRNDNDMKNPDGSKLFIGSSKWFTSNARKVELWELQEQFVGDIQAVDKDKANRFIHMRETQINKKFRKLMAQRYVERMKRIKKTGENTIGIVGYTNVGKSALCNAMMFHIGENVSIGQIAQGIGAGDGMSGNSILQLKMNERIRNFEFQIQN